MAVDKFYKFISVFEWRAQEESCASHIPRAFIYTFKKSWSFTFFFPSSLIPFVKSANVYSFEKYYMNIFPPTVYLNYYFILQLKVTAL